MSKLICSIDGVRGRSISVYDNKCVITTGVTIGSVISNNATDGEKTIFYVDVTGIQFKESGLTIGFIQLETSSSQMNNQNSNYFSENSFTFEGNNGYMRRVYEFIVARIEGYKYGTIENAPTDIPTSTEKERLVAERQEHVKQLMQAEAEQRERQKQEVEKQVKEIMEHVQQNTGTENIMVLFMEQASSLHSMTEILRLWKEFPEEYRESYSAITSKLENSAKNERLYGRDEKAVDNFINWMKELISM